MFSNLIRLQTLRPNSFSSCLRNLCENKWLTNRTSIFHISTQLFLSKFDDLLFNWQSNDDFWIFLLYSFGYLIFYGNPTWTNFFLGISYWIRLLFVDFDNPSYCWKGQERRPSNYWCCTVISAEIFQLSLIDHNFYKMSTFIIQYICTLYSLQWLMAITKWNKSWPKVSWTMKSDNGK